MTGYTAALAHLGQAKLELDRKAFTENRYPTDHEASIAARIRDIAKELEKLEAVR